MKQFSLLIGCYGADLKAVQAAISSAVENAEQGALRRFDLHVGANACSEPIITWLQSKFDTQVIDTLILSKDNRNKDPMMRLLIDRTTTPYVVWMDQDCVLKHDWDTAMERFIYENTPFDAAGNILKYIGSAKHYRFVSERPWFVEPEKLDEKTDFPQGCYFTARTAFLRTHNYPDKGMIKKNDDVLLGCLIQQHDGLLLPFPQEVRDSCIFGSHDVRGCGEEPEAFTKLDPVTGFERTTPPPVFELPARLGSFEERIRTLNDQSNDLFEAGELDRALELNDEALRECGGTVELWFNRGNILYKLDQLTSALEAYRRALVHDPGHQQSLLRLATIFLQLARYQEAMAMVERLLKEAPDLPVVQDLYHQAATHLDQTDAMERSPAERPTSSSHSSE